MSTTTSLYFWKPEEKPFGVFSQWYHSQFTDSKKVQYDNAEQYMMYQKALLFKDDVTATLILKCDNPRKIKALGRSIKGFDDKIWNEQKAKVAYAGNFHKFSQKESLKKILLSTKDRLLAEASPFDRIWGIGFKADEADGMKKLWGENILGQVLMKVREDLLEEKIKSGPPKDKIMY